ncbi:MAG: argininosuccinate synthase [Patescibacteria group bacterium]
MLEQKTSYIKTASYEGKIGEIKKVVLLYSGGVDTSCMLKWIQDVYKAEVIALTIDIGQQEENLDEVKAKALKLGAKKAYVIDAKDEFAEEYLALGIKANASYQRGYLLSTPMGRPLLSKWAVEIAKKENADAIAHGCTGTGNDQVRIEASALVFNPDIKIIAPVREWDMERTKELEYAKEHGIPVPGSIDFPYSVDDNMAGMTWEGGEIEDPKLIAPVKRFLTTYTLPEDAPDEEEIIKLTFKNGLPFELNDEKMPLASIIMKLNKIAGRHGVGVVHLVEDRLIGMKNRGIYESPGFHVIIEAHSALEHYVNTRQLNEIKETMDIKWAYLCYGALWLDLAMQAINAFNKHINKHVEGWTKIRLFKGKATVVALESPYGLDHASFDNEDKLNVNASAGFTEIYSLSMRLAQRKLKKMDN